MLPETSLSGCRKNLFAFVALLFVVLVIYSNTFDASWHFDDESNILENKPLHLTTLNLENIKKTFFASWKKGDARLYRPAACLSFALNYYFGGAEVYGYHMVNLIIHFLSSVFLFLFVYHTLNLPLLKQRYGSNSYFIALLSALLWALNPMQTQAVTYVVQRMTSMAGMFSIMAMYFYLKGRISTQNPFKTAHYIACCICGILAMGSKENAVMIPMVILLYDLFLIQGVTKENIKRYSFFLLIAVLICLALALLLAGPSILDPKWIVAGYQNRGFSLSERLLTEPRVILFYVSLLLYPMPDRLCLEHSITLSTGLITPISTIISIIVIVLIFCLACAWARKRPLISFCVLFFLMNHLIEASVFPLELIFEHRNYLPSMLLFVPISILLSGGIDFFSNRRYFQALLISFIILVLIGWGHSTYVRNMIWKSGESQWRDCVDKYPELARAHNNLGAYYGRQGKNQKAIRAYLVSLEKENKNNLVGKNWIYYNLGALYHKLGKDQKALFYYDQAQRYQPHFAPTLVNKGVIFLKRGLYEKARGEFLNALASDSENVDACGNLGYLHLLTGEPAKAMEYLESALQLEPENTKLMRHLALAYRLQGREKKAFTLLEASLDVKPDEPFTLLELSALYADNAMNRKLQETIDRFFSLFDGNLNHLKAFIDEIAGNIEKPSALAPHLQDLLALVAEGSRRQSQAFETLGDYCLTQISETPYRPRKKR